MNAVTRTATIGLALLLALSGTAAAQSQEAHQEDTNLRLEEEKEHGAHEVVRLTQSELDEFGIEIAKAGPSTLEIYLPRPGEVHPNEDGLAHIVPRYSGVVTEVYANIGDYVQKDQVLAVVESDESLAPYKIKTLISGTIINKHITLGEAVSREREAFMIADLSTVWIDLTVYQGDIHRIMVGQKVLIRVGHEPAGAEAKISYVTPVLDEKTRTATARIVLPNPDGRWLPGMFVTGGVLVDVAIVPLAVHRTALQRIGDDTVIFVKTDEGFEPRRVEIGRTDENLVEVVSGLKKGESYVSIGGFTLKAELGKEFLGDGHAH